MARSAVLAAVVVVLLSLCAVAGADDVSPDDIARAVIEAQLAAANDSSALARLLAPDAMILGNGSFAVAGEARAQAVLATFGSSPSGLPAISTSIDHLEAGETERAVWATADVTFLQVGRRGRSPPLVTHAHLIELIAPRGSYRQVIAFAFTSSSRASAPSDALAAPSDGPLTALVADAWRDRDARVVGAIEVRGGGWGFVAAELAIDDRRVAVLAIAAADERGRMRLATSIPQP